MLRSCGGEALRLGGSRGGPPYKGTSMSAKKEPTDHPVTRKICVLYFSTESLFS